MNDRVYTLPIIIGHGNCIILWTTGQEAVCCVCITGAQHAMKL